MSDPNEIGQWPWVYQCLVPSRGPGGTVSQSIAVAERNGLRWEYQFGKRGQGIFVECPVCHKWFSRPTDAILCHNSHWGVEKIHTKKPLPRSEEEL